MAERLSKLQETLAELNAELAQVDSLDEETREHLSRVASEILARVSQKKAAQTSVMPATPAVATQSKVDASGLQSRAEAFEADHPQLSAIVFRIVDLLGQVGI